MTLSGMADSVIAPGCDNRTMRRRSIERLDRGLGIVGGLALVVAVFGVVVYFDTRHQRDVGRHFLTQGVPSTATQVELRIKSGRGGDYVDEVEVVFSLATGGVRQATLTNNLGDTEGAKPGSRRAEPGTRYAPPLPVLYAPNDPRQVIAAADAHYFADDTTTSNVALGMITGGLAITTTVAFRHGVPALPRRRQRPPRRPGRHSRP